MTDQCRPLYGEDGKLIAVVRGETPADPETEAAIRDVVAAAARLHAELDAVTMDLVGATVIIVIAVSVWQSARGRITLFEQDLIGAAANLVMAIVWATQAAWGVVAVTACAVMVCSWSAWAVSSWDDAELRAKIRGTLRTALRRYLKEDG